MKLNMALPHTEPKFSNLRILCFFKCKFICFIYSSHEETACCNTCVDTN